MATTRYYDDPDIGPAPETSHPRFVELAGDDGSYFDCTEHYSPFGNDDGADMLSMLEEWYQDGGKDADIMEFVEETLDDWDFGLPDDIIRADHATVDAWLKLGDLHANYLASVCRGLVAAAFGQVKITGKLRPALRDEAQAAVARMEWLGAREQQIGEETAYLKKLKTALAQL
jgi:uncharacterized protein YfeS